jgi:hypothetical protein
MQGRRAFSAFFNFKDPEKIPVLQGEKSFQISSQISFLHSGKLQSSLKIRE